MITTDKLAEPAISVIEKPPANVIHQMAPPPASRQRPPLFAAGVAVPLLSGPALNTIAFAGRFQGTPETEKFETPARAVATQAVENEVKPAKRVAETSAAKKPLKKRQIAGVDKQKSKTVAAANRTENPTGGNSFSSTQSVFSGGPFGALFGSRANQ